MTRRRRKTVAPEACEHRNQRVRSLGDSDENQEVVCLDCCTVLMQSESVPLNAGGEASQ